MVIVRTFLVALNRLLRILTPRPRIVQHTSGQWHSKLRQLGQVLATIPNHMVRTLATHALNSLVVCPS